MAGCFISFIVPVYNAEKYLSECLESILDQTVPDFEIIVVDDGSADGSGFICDRYAAQDERVRVLHTENHGVAHARNIALEMAEGTYISFVDADDRIHPQLAETVLNCFEAYEDVAMVCWKVLKFSEANNGVSDNFWNDLREQNAGMKTLKISEMLWRVIDDIQIAGYSCNKAFLKSIINRQIRFQENIAVMEDLLFTCEYLKQCTPEYSAVFVDCEMYGYRQIQTSVLHAPFSEKKLSSLFAREKVLEILTDTGIDSEKINSYHNQLLRALCVMNKKLRGFHSDRKSYWQNIVDLMWMKYNDPAVYDDTWSFKEKCYRIMLQVALKFRMNGKGRRNES